MIYTYIHQIVWVFLGSAIANSFAMHREGIAKANASSVGACNVCKKCAHKFYKKRNETKEGNPPQKSETEAIYKASEQKKKKVAI